MSWGAALDRHRARTIYAGEFDHCVPLTTPILFKQPRSIPDTDYAMAYPTAESLLVATGSMAASTGPDWLQ